MDTQSNPSSDGLFYESLIRSYVDAPHFVERPWLAERIETALADPDCRFLLLTAEPGAGKTAFTAWLARQHPDWPRYFIRRDSRIPLSSGDARSFLFAVGHQLAALRPTLFRPDKLEVVVKQRVSELQAGGRAIGIEAKDLRVSPFYQTALKVEQDVKVVAGELAGLSVKRMVTEERFLEVGNLQHLALLDPAGVLSKEDAATRIVILVDALDELRYHAGRDNLLKWLATCPELPSNVCFVLTSRPDDELLGNLRHHQQRWLREETIDLRSEQVQADLRHYALNFVAQESVNEALSGQDINPNRFVDQAVTKAEGNFQYLAALSRGIEQAIEAGEEEQLDRLLQDVPTGLEELYAFFFTLIKDSVADQQVEVPGAAPFQVSYQSAWEELYQPLLGVLAVAREPLDAEQITGFGNIRAEGRWVRGALGRLEQFLDREDGRYRLYHSTFPEFLTSPETRATHPHCYLDPAEWHRKIAAHYRVKLALGRR